MKKIFILFAIIILFLGCEFMDSTVPDSTVQKALDIAYNEITNMNLNYNSPLQYVFIKQYLENQNYKKIYECGILDMSNVQGTKHIKACLLKNANSKPDDFIKESPHVLVMAESTKENRDIVLLIFFNDAQKTEKGYSYSKIMPLTILVNLKTKKIGTL